MPFCTKCGSQVETVDRFCHSCGAPAVEPSSSGDTKPPPPPLARPPSPPTAGAAPPTPPYREPEPTLEELAEQRVKGRMGLLQHLGVYLVVNAFLVIVWALTGAGYPWFLWPAAGWGTAVAIHAISYSIGSEKDARRRSMIEREMERMRRRESAEAEGSPSPSEGEGQR